MTKELERELVSYDEMTCEDWINNYLQETGNLEVARLIHDIGHLTGPEGGIVWYEVDSETDEMSLLVDHDVEVPLAILERLRMYREEVKLWYLTHVRKPLERGSEG